jgi:dihydrodipicolinate synthase/N-acetylneuraminate lyase
MGRNVDVPLRYEITVTHFEQNGADGFTVDGPAGDEEVETLDEVIELIEDHAEAIRTKLKVIKHVVEAHPELASKLLGG